MRETAHSPLHNVGPPGGAGGGKGGPGESTGPFPTFRVTPGVVVVVADGTAGVAGEDAGWERGLFDEVIAGDTGNCAGGVREWLYAECLALIYVPV